MTIAVATTHSLSQCLRSSHALETVPAGCAAGTGLGQLGRSPLAVGDVAVGDFALRGAGMAMNPWYGRTDRAAFAATHTSIRPHAAGSEAQQDRSTRGRGRGRVAI